MKSRLLLALAGFLLCASCTQQKPSYITIKGNIQFQYDPSMVEITERQGFDKIIIDSVKPDSNGDFLIRMKVDKPGVYTLSYRYWQSVDFWAEDEDLVINMRGMDTARIKIKNPPYVYIAGGPNNEVMNLLNWDNHRNYQQMIAVSKAAYARTELSDENKQALATELYGILGDESRARARYLAEHYADRHSVLAVLGRLRGEEDETLIDKVVRRLEEINPDYAPLVKFVRERAEAKENRERLAAGQPAPPFSFPEADGTRSFGPSDFKGKILVLDFWASWCGPCRAEIPHLKELYEAFAEKGVEILSVSIDKKESDWRKALAEEKMPWPQVQAPGSGKEVMKQYQFSGIPHILVIDKEGRIVGKNLRGKSLSDKIEELTSGKKPVSLPAMGM